MLFVYSQILGLLHSTSSRGVAADSVSPGAGVYIVNEREPEWVTYLEPQVLAGNLTDSANMSVYFYDLPTSVARRNRHIYPADTPGSLKVANLMEVFSRVKAWPVPSDFVYPGERDTFLVPVTRDLLARLPSVS